MFLSSTFQNYAQKQREQRWTQEMQEWHLIEQTEVKPAGCTKAQQLVSPPIQEAGWGKGWTLIFESQYKVRLDPSLPYASAHPGQKRASESEKLWTQEHPQAEEGNRRSYFPTGNWWVSPSGLVLCSSGCQHPCILSLVCSLPCDHMNHQMSSQ